MTEEQKTYYKNNVCAICANAENCNKDKFILTTIFEKHSIKCLSYDYKNKEI